MNGVERVVLASTSAALLAGALLAGRATHAADGPRREDFGSLVVLHVYGSYTEMGRQQVELLGPTASAVERLFATRWSGLINGLGFTPQLANRVMLPILGLLGWSSSDSPRFPTVG